MKALKKLIISTLLLSVISTSVFAETCYNPRYGYYQCRPVHYVQRCYSRAYGYYNCEPTVRQTNYYDNTVPNFVAGAVVGLLVGGALQQNQNHYWHHRRGWHHW